MTEAGFPQPSGSAIGARRPSISGPLDGVGPQANGANRSDAGSAQGSDNPTPPVAATTPPADPDKQKPALDLLPSVSSPKGGGAIRGMGEKFSVNAATGAATASVPLPFSAGRAGFTPALGLSYDSGGGN